MGYLVCCVCLFVFVCLYGCGFLSGGWLAWSHGGGITSGMSYIEIALGQSELGAMAWWTFGIGGGGVA